jgi:hypothetical protein
MGWIILLLLFAAGGGGKAATTGVGCSYFAQRGYPTSPVGGRYILFRNAERNDAAAQAQAQQWVDSGHLPDPNGNGVWFMTVECPEGSAPVVVGTYI